MVRVHERRRAASVGAGAARHKKAGFEKKPSYKVVLEEVSEQKKLKTLVCCPFLNKRRSFSGPYEI